MFKKILLSLLLLLFILIMLYNPTPFKNKVALSLNLCAKGVIPSLFIFMVLSDFAIRTNCFEPIIKFLSPFIRLFGLSDACFEALFWGAFSGFPLGAKTTALLYKNSRISKSEGEALLSFTNNCSPAFLVGFFGNTGLKIYFIQLFCALISGFFICKILKPEPLPPSFRKRESEGAARALTLAIGSSVEGILKVCGFIIFLGAVITVFESKGSLPPFICGIFEITSGLSQIAINSRKAFGAACFLSSFGSFSVLLQSFAFVYPERLSMKNYLYGKAVSALLSFLGGIIFYS